MKLEKISTQYAKIIYDYAFKQGNETLIYKGMQSLVKNFSMFPILKKIINNPIISDEKKIKLLIAIVCHTNDNNKILEQIIKIIIKNSKSNCINRIAQIYEKIYQESNAIIIVKLTIASFGIDYKLKKALVKFFSKKTNAQIEIHTEINLNIIGGFILEIGDQLLDASVKKQLNQLKCKMQI